MQTAFKTGKYAQPHTIREMYMKTTKFYFPPIRSAKIKTPDDTPTRLKRLWRNGDSDLAAGR